MKGQRILLLLSPLLYFVPPLLPSVDSPGFVLLGFFFVRILRRFPWNLLMAFFCYTYAQKLGREAWRWSLGAFVVPYLAPLILAFVPPAFGSRAAEAQTRGMARPVKTFNGPFDERFPLLDRLLSEQPEPLRSEQKLRFAVVPSNFEFSMVVQENALPQILSDAELRRFTVWAASDRHLLGAGVVRADGFNDTVAWLRRSSAAQHKLEVSFRDANGGIKFFEYYA